MKKIVILAALLWAVPVEAQVDECVVAGKTAESIMYVRQTDMPLGKFLEIAKRNRESEQYVSMILAAYRVPKFNGLYIIDSISKQFGLDYQVECMERRNER